MEIHQKRRQANEKDCSFCYLDLSKFTHEEIEEIIKGLSDVLANRNPDVKPKDDFKEKHPHYRDFFVDPSPPLKAPLKTTPRLDWRKLLSTYEEKRGRPLKPVDTKNPQTKVPESSTCKICGAPTQYLYFNDGRRRSQLKCKVCSSLSQVHPRYRNKTKYFCPHCNHFPFHLLELSIPGEYHFTQGGQFSVAITG